MKCAWVGVELAKESGNDTPAHKSFSGFYLASFIDMALNGVIQ